jgi:hypothetical protein
MPQTPEPTEPPPDLADGAAVFLRHHVDNIANIARHPVFAFFFALGFGCLIGAWFSSGEMFVVAPVLIIGWLFVIVGWAWAPNLSKRARGIWIAVSTGAILIEGGALHFHYHISTDELAQGAMAEIAAEIPERLANGKYSFSVDIKSVGDMPMVNYHFLLGSVARPYELTFEQENEEFYNKVSKQFEEEKRKNKEDDEIGKVLRSGTLFRMSDERTQIEQWKYDTLVNGTEFYYVFLTVTYTDKKTDKNILYLAHYCAEFAPLYRSYKMCHHENFSKRPMAREN